MNYRLFWLKLQVFNFSGTQIHHQGLHICLGAFCTSSKESLHAEGTEPPLEIRSLKFSLNYYIKLKANPNNPAYDCVFKPLVHKFEEKSK